MEKAKYPLVLTIAAMLCFSLGWGWFSCTTQQRAGIGRPEVYKPVASETCRGWQFERYDSSPFEMQWLNHADAWGRAPCEALRGMQREADEWQRLAAHSMQAPLPHTVSSDVLSSFWYRTCNGTLVRVPIEPIGGVNRHPFTCNDLERYLLDKDSWLVIDWHAHAPPSARSFMFDVGASTWHSGIGGASQVWFYEMHRKRNITFDAFYAWEATKHDPEEVWRQIPAQVRPAYHWLNVPAQFTKGSVENPLEIIRRIARPEDFVVLKLDIDTPSVEMPLVEQLSSDPELLALVDEFYFEHHVNMEPLASCCWMTTQARETAASSYRLFFKLRKAGVRAHSWV